MKLTNSDEKLWKAVVSDPNNVRHLYAWIDDQERVEPRDDRQRFLKRLAQLPGSWLAKIWLTRTLLADGKLDVAMTLYKEALAMAPQTSLAVQEISGHLGEAGYYQEAIELLLPLYSPDNHGPYAGFNLFNACEDAHDWDSAQEVLDRMKKAQWSDEIGPRHFKEIVRIRQKKLALLREMRDESNATFN